MTVRSSATADSITVRETDKNGRLTFEAVFPLIPHPVLRRQRWFELRQAIAASIGSSRADNIVGSAIARQKKLAPKKRNRQLRFGDNDG